MGMSSGGLGGLRVVVTGVSGTVSSVKSSTALVVLGETCCFNIFRIMIQS